MERLLNWHLEMAKALPESEKYIPALGYAPLTRFYDSVVALTTRERTFKSALITQANPAANTRLLDIACGTGTLAVRLKAQHPAVSITGIDGDPVILSMARSKAHKAGLSLQLDRGMSHDLPYPDNTFETVVSSLFFHHLNTKVKQQTASEAYRVLKPGGTLHIADWGKPDNRIMSYLFYGIQLLDGFANTSDNRKGLLPQILRQAGFKMVKTHSSFNTALGTIVLNSGVKQ